MGLASLRRRRELLVYAPPPLQAEPVQEMEPVPVVVEDKLSKPKKTKPEKE